MCAPHGVCPPRLTQSLTRASSCLLGLEPLPTTCSRVLGKGSDWGGAGGLLRRAPACSGQDAEQACRSAERARPGGPSCPAAPKGRRGCWALGWNIPGEIDTVCQGRGLPTGAGCHAGCGDAPGTPLPRRWTFCPSAQGPSCSPGRNGSCSVCRACAAHSELAASISPLTETQQQPWPAGDTWLEGGGIADLGRQGLVNPGS